ncbi:MAG: polysaccharide biosynthesis protein [Allopontixanthobacter sediminis]
MNKPNHNFGNGPDIGTATARADKPWLERLAFKGMEQTITMGQIMRLSAVLAIDFATVFLTLGLTFFLDQRPLFDDLVHSLAFITAFSAVACGCFLFAGLYKRSWRFVDFSHSIFLGSVITVGLTVSWGASAAGPLRTMGADLVPVAIIHWAFATICMVGTRMARRAWCERRDRRNSRKAREGKKTVVQPVRTAILIGSHQWARLSIELANAEEVSTVRIAAVLLPNRESTLSKINDVPVLGSQQDILGAVEFLTQQGMAPQYVIVCDDGTYLSNRDVSQISHRCRELGLEVCRMRDPLAQLLQRASSSQVSKLPIEALLGRTECNLDNSSVVRQIADQCILVTGAGGTIGSELSRQIASLKPARLVLVDHSEFNLYRIETLLREGYPDLSISAEYLDICDRAGVSRLFARHRPSMVFHAAALKHVPIVEGNACAGALTNVIGTRNIADAVCEYSAKAMVQISTDKAVNPIGVMGATKRVGELYCQALDMCGVDDPEAPRFMTVRFGNVLGSSGSILPLFERQLREGSPLTVTHPDIERYFMTVREAVQLILQSSSSALEEQTRRGSIFVLDMGAPVRIVDLARRMITLYGLEPDVDVPIQFVGLRPGEKLYEELFDMCEEQFESAIPGIFEARSRPLSLSLIIEATDKLQRLAEQGDEDEVKRVVHDIVRSWDGTRLPNPSPLSSALSMRHRSGRSELELIDEPTVTLPEQDLFHQNKSLKIAVTSSWPSYEADEIEAVTRVLASGKVNGLVHGHETGAFALEFAEFCGASQGICMSNGTVTLEIGLRALGIGLGDEVIIPARSFFATASCVLAVGATPVFADIEETSQNIDPASVERLIGPRTRAVICVHLAGWPCDVFALRNICDKHGLSLVEDCAQAHGAQIAARPVGSFGDIASFSFCTDKIISTGGEGGILLCRDRDVYERAWSLKDHGKNRQKLTDCSGRPGGFRYVHDSPGTNARMTELQAAIGRVQLRKLPGWLAARSRNAALLSEMLENHRLIKTPRPPANIRHAWYKYYVMLADGIERPAVERGRIIESLIAQGIPCGSGSCPDMSRELGVSSCHPRRDGELATARRVGERTIMLAVDHTLGPKDMECIARTLGELVE